MQKLYISPGRNTPEISFSPDENLFFIRGNSAPEDVRALYYPVLDWFRKFSDELLSGDAMVFSVDDPMILRIDLKYFNSSSAKFLYDILMEMKNMISGGIPVVVEWCYEKDDPELKEAGYDISVIAEMEFRFIEKNEN